MLGPTDLGIRQSIAFDDLSAVAKERERPTVLLQPSGGLGSVVLRDREQYGALGFDLGKRLLQLTELLLAVGSPVAAPKELQDDRFLAAEVRELVDLTGRIG